jgi:hypothetical protein
LVEVRSGALDIDDRQAVIGDALLCKVETN